MNKTKINFYIRIVSDIELERAQVARSYNAIAAALPSGVLTSIEVPKGDSFGTAYLVHRKGNSGARHYIIPLTRNLTNSEFKHLGDCVTPALVEGCTLESSGATVACVREKPTRTKQINPEYFEKFCLELARVQHSNWYSKKSNEGWNYGIEHSAEAKTSPLLRPWQELPEAYKSVDQTYAKQVIEIIEDLGMLILPQDVLVDLMRKK